jgi:NAD(P)H-hydrate epimerase
MFLTRAAARALDDYVRTECGVPGVVLMENAGRGVAQLLRTLGVAGPVVVLCGGGNNGGDGFVVARHLDNFGVAVCVLLFADPGRLVGDAAVHFPSLAFTRATVLTLSNGLDAETWRRELAGADWVVDALVGSGQQGTLRPPLEAVVADLGACGARVLAVDLPSGLDCDLGEPQGLAVRADHTATIVAPKAGFARASAQPYIGKVHVIDMGMPARAWDAVQPSTASARSG